MTKNSHGRPNDYMLVINLAPALLYHLLLHGDSIVDQVMIRLWNQTQIRTTTAACNPGAMPLASLALNFICKWDNLPNAYMSHEISARIHFKSTHLICDTPQEPGNDEGLLSLILVPHLVSVPINSNG